jgi:hypothetical protein
VPALADQSIAAALHDAMPEADVEFSNATSELHPETGMFSYLHKVKDGRNIYFFANSTDGRVETEVTLRGDLKLESWNPHTGETSPLKTSVVKKNGRSFTRAALQLDPVTSVFFVEAPTTQSK